MTVANILDEVSGSQLVKELEKVGNQFPRYAMEDRASKAKIGLIIHNVASYILNIEGNTS